MIDRIPIRLRLALAFAVAMALLLIVLGVVLRVSLAGQIDEGIDSSLRARADDVAALLDGGDPALDAGRLTAETEDGFTQIIDARGRVVAASSSGLDAPLLDPRLLAAAERGTVATEIGPVADVDADSRLLARPAVGGPEPLVVVVGTSLEPRAEAISGLTRLLVLLGPIALILASAGGYLLAGAALRPVEAMRRRAQIMSGTAAEGRLPVPPARDELRRLAETLNAMLDRVDAGIARERDFVADAGHELRTPLAILKAELELALDGARPPGELRAALASAQEETDRLSRLADDLLVISRAERGGLPVRLEPTPILRLLERCQARLAATSGSRPVVVSADPELVVDIDPDRMEQALVNLLDNALRHGAGRVSLAASADGAGLRIVVKDEGGGIPDELGEHAFERFSRGGGRGPGAGAGLGLPIVRAVAEAHGGTAAVDRDGGVVLHVSCRPGARREVAGT